MSRALISAGACCALLLAGCGEKTQVTVYKQGEYQGKPDARPWDNERFKNDRAAWDKTIRARTIGQNEYARISGN
jgi:major membrane immunogen (membrane-anchored lipoprotein)